MICDKVSYLKHKDAADQVVPLSKKTGKKYSIYKCPECKLFHIATIIKGKKTFRQKEKYKKVDVGAKGERKIKQINLPPVKKSVVIKSVVTTYKPFEYLRNKG